MDFRAEYSLGYRLFSMVCAVPVCHGFSQHLIRTKGMSSGIPQLQKIVREFTDRVLQPGYENYTTLLHAGNTDAWSKVVTTLCNPGEGVLVSKWTYPSAMASMQPFNINPVPVDIDAQGMRSDALRTVLTEWDEVARGMPRYHWRLVSRTFLIKL